MSGQDGVDVGLLILDKIFKAERNFSRWLLKQAVFAFLDAALIVVVTACTYKSTSYLLGLISSSFCPQYLIGPRTKYHVTCI